MSGRVGETVETVEKASTPEEGPSSRRRVLRRRPLTPQTVLALQGHRSYPSVSLLMTTRPGAEPDPADVARFDALVAEAQERLRTELPPMAATVVRALDAVSGLEGPVDRAVAVYVSPGLVSRVDLPVEVVDRTVVDPTFATRDLVRALHRTPRHVVLLLTGDTARIFDGAGETLSPVRPSYPLADPNHRPGDPPGIAFQTTVDKALGAHLRVHPAPLILVGPEPALSSFRRMSRNTQRLAGTIVTERFDEVGADLRDRIRGVLEEYLRSRRDEALALLAERTTEGRALLGMQDAWTAARWERPEMLMVEESFYYPARLGDGAETLVPASDPHAPDVIDDVVDELIELVLARGGWIALLEDGTLPDGAGVALTLRRRR